MAWRRPGDKPLSEAVLVCCTDAYMRQKVGLNELNIILTIWQTFWSNEKGYH